MTPLLSSALLRTQSDERLLRLAKQGHESAFEAIVDRYRRPLLRYVHRLLPGDRAEDVLQVAFVSAWTAMRAGADVRDLRPWLYRICHNGALNALARRGYDHAELKDTLQGAASPAEALESRDAVRQTLGSVAELPARQRDALLAVAVEGRPHGEVARELGLSDGALRQLVHRARSSVRSAVTAVTPAPVVNWILQAGSRELIGGAGVAGAAKAAAIAVATGAVVAGGVTHVAGHHAGAAVAAAAAVRHAAPPVVARPRVAAVRHVRPRGRHVARAHVRPRVTVALGGRTDRVVAVPPLVRRRHSSRRPSQFTGVTHAGTTGQAPASSAPASSGDGAAPPASGQEPTPATPVDTTPAPAPAPCHEVACRPVTQTTPPPTEPPPPPTTTTTEPVPPPPTTTTADPPPQI